MRYQEVADHLWPLWFIWLPLGLTRATQIVLFDRLLDRPRTWWLKRVNPRDYPPGDTRLSLIAYVSMCIFCMPVDIGLVWALLSGVPWVSSFAVIVLAALAAAFLVPILDHWSNEYLPDKPTLSQDEIDAWSHGGVPERSPSELDIDQQIAALEGDDDGEN